MWHLCKYGDLTSPLLNKTFIQIFVFMAYCINSTVHFRIPTNNVTLFIILNTWFAINKTSITELYQNIFIVNTNISLHRKIFRNTLHSILYTVSVAIWIVIYCIEIAVPR